MMRILLVEDHAATRLELRKQIEREGDMRVVAEAGTGEDGVAQARIQHPDIVVMDILLPRMNGIEAARMIRSERPDTKILAVSNHFGDSLIKAILDAGGLGYVMKSRAYEELIPALRAVNAGLQYISGAPAVHAP